MERFVLPSLALVLLGACGGGPELRCWAADRGADELVLLDAELCVARRVPMPAPHLLAAAPGALWIGTADGGGELCSTLVRLEPGRDEPRSTSFETLAALCAEESGDALVIERAGGGTRLWRVDARLGRTLLGRFPAACALAERAGEVLVGGSDTSLVRVTERGGIDAAGHWDGPVQALAPGPRAGEWWVLGGPGGASVGLVDAELEPRWIAETGMAARAFAPEAGRERVWLADGRVLRCYGPGGALELEHALALAQADWRAVSAGDAGVVLLADGSLLELRARAGVVEPVRSQGGFRALSALVALPAQGH